MNVVVLERRYPQMWEQDDSIKYVLLSSSSAHADQSIIFFS